MVGYRSLEPGMMVRVHPSQPSYAKSGDRDSLFTNSKIALLAIFC